MPGKAIAQKEKLNTIDWSVAAQLPAAAGMQKQLGLAGVFTGVSNNVLLIAGGSNFADGAMPWQGGKKLHFDDIYLLAKNAAGAFNWLKPAKAIHLKQKTAYGASTTVNNGVVCAGGETEDASSSKHAFIMRWDAIRQEVVFADLPPVPVSLANACMTSIGEVIYLIGGESEGKPTAQCFTLNLAAKGAQWQALPPLPLAMSHSVAVTQSNGKHPCVYVIGGRSSTASGISTLHNSTFCYDPEYKKWMRLKNVGDGLQITNISAATGVASGATDIVLIGGDKGDIFHRIETYNSLIAHAPDKEEKKCLQQEKIELLNHHPGFSKDVYVYNTVANSWRKLGALPFYGQVTTTAVKWGNEIFIPGGEIKPGTRTLAVTRGKFNAK
nr:galactose oxidase [Mucilaginibacter sp. SP1R1]MBB6152232.1 N-acetylneuraminic acid mutarotase [Mucilaginibacter sp. SP1R1]